MDSVTTGAVCRESIPSAIRKAVKSVIIRFYGGAGECVLFRDAFRSMTLRTGCKGDSLLIDRRIRVYFCLDPVDAMASGARGRIRSPSSSEHSMHAVRKLFRDIRMA